MSHSPGRPGSKKDPEAKNDVMIMIGSRRHEVTILTIHTVLLLARLAWMDRVTFFSCSRTQMSRALLHLGVNVDFTLQN